MDTLDVTPRTAKGGKKMNDFEKLFSLNVNEHTEVKDTGSAKLTYLSWAWAWSEFKKVYPDAAYTIGKNEQGLPYFNDDAVGAMVYTTVTAGGITYEMWLPVMDGNNRAMKTTPYQVKTKYKTIDVNAFTMFDVNKAVMRCLVKNLAMFGLGLYIYAGEDLPEAEQADVIEEKPKARAPKAKQTAPKAEKPSAASDHAVTELEINVLSDRCFVSKVDTEKLCAMCQVGSLSELNAAQYRNIMDNWEKVKEKCSIV